MNNPIKANQEILIIQACKDANISLTLAIISVYASTIPVLGVVTSLVAERIAYQIPEIQGIKNINTKKNIVHYLTPLTFVLSILFFVIYYHYINKHSITVW